MSEAFRAATAFAPAGGHQTLDGPRVEGRNAAGSARAYLDYRMQAVFRLMSQR